MYTNVGLNIDPQAEKLEKQKALLDGTRAPTRGAGSIPISELGAPLLVNRDQWADKGKDELRRVEFLSPIVKTVQGKVAAKFYEDTEFGALLDLRFCWSCDRTYGDNRPLPDWAVASEHKCKTCGMPGGMKYLEQLPIHFAKLSDFKNQIKDEESQEDAPRINPAL